MLLTKFTRLKPLQQAQLSLVLACLSDWGSASLCPRAAEKPHAAFTAKVVPFPHYSPQRY